MVGVVMVGEVVVGAARDVVVVGEVVVGARRMWSARSWSELLGGAARDVVGEVVVGEIVEVPDAGVVSSSA